MAANKLKKIRFALVLVSPFCFGLEMRKIWTAGHETQDVLSLELEEAKLWGLRLDVCDRKFEIGVWHRR